MRRKEEPAGRWFEVVGLEKKNVGGRCDGDSDDRKETVSVTKGLCISRTPPGGEEE